MTPPVASPKDLDVLTPPPAPDETMASDDLLRIFAARARKLAQPIVRSKDNAGDRQVLVVVIDRERYAIDSRSVIEVQATGRIVPVPGIGDIWRGLVNLRGHLYATLDLGRFLTQLHLHAPSDATRNEGRFVLAKASDLTIALFVDDVQAVRHVAASAILPPVVDAQDGERRPVIGMTDDLVVLLDVDVLFQTIREYIPANVS